MLDERDQLTPGSAVWERLLCTLTNSGRKPSEHPKLSLEDVHKAADEVLTWNCTSMTLQHLKLQQRDLVNLMDAHLCVSNAPSATMANALTTAYMANLNTAYIMRLDLGNNEPTVLEDFLSSACCALKCSSFKSRQHSSRTSVS
jgi:hypothetical protein